VDIASQTLDARIGRDGEWRQFARTETGIGELVTFCKDNHITLVVMEATGGYERLPFSLLWAAEIPVAIVNPRSVRRFAEAMGRLEKTDRIDCAMIAWYAETKRIQASPPASATQQRLTALVLRLRQLTELQTQQKNQRRLVSDQDVQDSFTAVLQTIARQMRALQNTITAIIDADPLWAALDEAFREINGVADRTVARLIADLPEIGTLSGKAVAKLNGMAPIACDSGQKSGRRLVRGGRESVRTILYMVAQVVRRHDPDFMAFYETLKAKGKPHKVIRIALARKLLVRLNAKARDARKALASAV
jgi:transposase